MPKSKPSTPASFVDPYEAPQLSADWFEQADLHQGSKLVRRGRPPSPDKKQLVSLRLSPDVLEGFRQSGPGWQTRIDDTLRLSLKKQRARTGGVHAEPSRRAETRPSAKKPGAKTPLRKGP